jgi:hypothetical protein
MNDSHWNKIFKVLVMTITITFLFSFSPQSKAGWDLFKKSNLNPCFEDNFKENIYEKALANEKKGTSVFGKAEDTIDVEIIEGAFPVTKIENVVETPKTIKNDPREILSDDIIDIKNQLSQQGLSNEKASLLAKTLLRKEQELIKLEKELHTNSHIDGIEVEEVIANPKELQEMFTATTKPRPKKQIKPKPAPPQEKQFTEAEVIQSEINYLEAMISTKSVPKNDKEKFKVKLSKKRQELQDLENKLYRSGEEGIETEVIYGNFDEIKAGLNNTSKNADTKNLVAPAKEIQKSAHVANLLKEIKEIHKRLDEITQLRKTTDDTSKLDVEFNQLVKNVAIKEKEYHRHANELHRESTVPGIEVEEVLYEDLPTDTAIPSVTDTVTTKEKKAAPEPNANPFTETKDIGEIEDVEEIEINILPPSF